jgi:CcmD family protein
METNMTDVQWLLCASMAVWLGIGCYAAFLASTQNKLERRVRQLETSRHA